MLLPLLLVLLHLEGPAQPHASHTGMVRLFFQLLLLPPLMLLLLLLILCCY